MEIPLHAEVACSDGGCGESTYVIVDPRSDKLTHVVVEENGLPAEEHLVPVDLIVATRPDRIQLRCTREQLAGLKPFTREEYLPGTESYLSYPPDGYMTWPANAPEIPLPVEVPQIPPGSLSVERGTRVQATDGEVGKVDELLIDPVTNQVTHVILSEGALWAKKRVTIPVSEIDRITENVIYLKLNKEAVGRLPTKPGG
jgi:uncharacterized protein YrrD